MKEAGREEPLRLLLVEDHDSFRQALAFIFERQPDFTVVAQASSVAQAREGLEGIDVAVVDLVLPDGDGTEVIEDLRRENPEALILVLSASLAPGRFRKTLELGADGVLDKLASVREILDAVRRLRSGEALLWQDEVKEMLRSFAHPPNREALDDPPPPTTSRSKRSRPSARSPPAKAARASRRGWALQRRKRGPWSAAPWASSGRAPGFRRWPSPPGEASSASNDGVGLRHRRRFPAVYALHLPQFG